MYATQRELRRGGLQGRNAHEGGVVGGDEMKERKERKGKGEGWR